jgi:hypothetical protein
VLGRAAASAGRPGFAGDSVSLERAVLAVPVAVDSTAPVLVGDVPDPAALCSGAPVAVASGAGPRPVEALPVGLLAVAASCSDAPDAVLSRVGLVLVEALCVDLLVASASCSGVLLLRADLLAAVALGADVLDARGPCSGASEAMPLRDGFLAVEVGWGDVLPVAGSPSGAAAGVVRGAWVAGAVEPACAPVSGARVGNRAATRKPPLGRGPAVRAPPSAWVRSRMPMMPLPPPVPERAGALVGRVLSTVRSTESGV